MANLDENLFIYRECVRAFQFAIYEISTKCQRQQITFFRHGISRHAKIARDKSNNTKKILNRNSLLFFENSEFSTKFFMLHIGSAI